MKTKVQLFQKGARMHKKNIRKLGKYFSIFEKDILKHARPVICTDKLYLA